MELIAKLIRVVWWPFGLVLRSVAWVMAPPLGWALSRRRRSARRHRELVTATRQGGTCCGYGR